jgi:hypothetical protein
VYSLLACFLGDWQLPHVYNTWSQKLVEVRKYVFCIRPSAQLLRRFTFNYIATMSAEVKAAGGSSTSNNPKKGAKGGRPPKGEAKAKQNAKEVKPKPSKPAKPSAPREPPKKLYRIVIRKLPPKDFTEADFLTCLDRVCSQTEHTLQRSAFVFEHFIPGKIRYASHLRQLLHK